MAVGGPHPPSLPLELVARTRPAFLLSQASRGPLLYGDGDLGGLGYIAQFGGDGEGVLTLRYAEGR